MVKAWIMNVVSKQIYASILYFQDAHEIWKVIAKHFHKSNLSLIYRLETDSVSSTRIHGFSFLLYYKGYFMEKIGQY